MAWAVETLNDTVDAEPAELPADMRARLVRIAELIETVGLPSVREPPSGTYEGRFGRFASRVRPGSRGRCT
jgi:hypothetical protein